MLRAVRGGLLIVGLGALALFLVLPGGGKGALGLLGLLALSLALNLWLLPWALRRTLGGWRPRLPRPVPAAGPGDDHRGAGGGNGSGPRPGPGGAAPHPFPGGPGGLPVPDLRPAAGARGRPMRGLRPARPVPVSLLRPGGGSRMAALPRLRGRPPRRL
jgi:hypothetical protein